MFLELVYVETSVFFAQVSWSLTRVLSRKDVIPHRDNSRMENEGLLFSLSSDD